MTRKKPTDGAYEVGYAKPPKASQFVKGTSGNPKGRAKGSENFRDLFEREGAELMPISENGKPKTVTKQAALAKSLYQKGIKGDVSAAKVILAALPQAESPVGPGQGYALTQADIDVLQNHADLIGMIEEARKDMRNEQDR